ncbi:type VI secretion system protein TssA [Pseudomonas sp. R4-84]
MSYSEELSEYYLKLAQTPISNGNFAGADMRFSDEYEVLEVELGKAQSVHENGRVDWLNILERGEALLRTQSKDLRVAAWMTWALYQRDSFQGLLAGVGLLRYLCKNHWAELYPLKVRTRAASLSWLLPRLEEALGDDVAIKTQLTLFQILAEQLEDLDAVFTDHLGDDAPLLLPLCRRLRSLVQRSIDNKPPPSAVEAIVAQVKQTATQLFTADVPIENEKDAHRALRAQQESARSLCTWWLKQKATDARALRLNRTVLWLSIDAVPEHDVELKTLLRGLPADKLRAYRESFQQSNYANLLVEIEASLAKAPFWFDGQRLAWECLQGLGAEPAMREQEIHFALFLQRLPGVIELRWHDGEPFADPSTRAWIAAHVMPRLDLPDAGPRTDVIDNHMPWERALEEAQVMLRNESLKSAVQFLSQAMQNTYGGRTRFLWRFAMARLCFSAKKYELAKAQLEVLDQTLLGADLNEWEPDLALQVLHLLYRCCELLPQNHLVRECRDETYRRLCHLDLERVIE